MADTKISALPASTTPLAGTEVLPIVQSGATKQVSVANLTAGRAISAASITASTGNFVVGTSGQGIDFSATPGTGTSELLADYEEGTWTVVWTSLTGTPSNTTGYYTKIGRTVYFTYAAGANALAGVGDVTKFSLPFTPALYAAGSMISQSNTNAGSLLVDPGAVVYPGSFSGGFMVFSGTYSV
jgi:hypothetical protein